MKKVAIVGAGLGGLSSAIHLALAGFSVEVFDQAADAGGKASERRLGAFRFDAGPSLVTMASVWDELFAAAGRRREDYLKLTPLDPIFQAFWPAGDRLTIPGTARGLAKALSEKGWAVDASTKAWFDHAKSLWDLAGPLFLRRSLHDPKTWTLRETWATLLRAGQLDAGRTLRQAIDSQFSDHRVRQFFGRYATYNGSDPRQIPATFAMIPWVEYGLGAWAADDGIHAIPRSMHRLASELGVKFHFSTKVTGILHDRGRVQGVKVRRESLDFDAVVSNADVLPTYQLLESEQPLAGALARWRNRYRRGQPSTAGVVFLWGMDKVHPELGLHNLFFAPDRDAEFRAIHDEKRLPDDPTVYVNIGSKVTPGDAPPGQESWFVLVNAPHDPGPRRIANPEAIARLRCAVLSRIETNLGRSVESSIVQERILSPADLEESTGSPGGSLYGLASHSAFAAFDRHPNRAPHFQGLYFCGGSAHPGGGMPLAVLSGRIAAELATRDLSSRRR